MNSPTAEVVQVHITLEDIEPPIWRRLRVARNGTFWDLHVAIQDAMGWLDYHLHEFSLELKSGQHIRIGSAFEDEQCLRSWEMPIRAFLQPGVELAYDYDFGDGWRHRIVVEEPEPRAGGRRLPWCAGGERACPPEDCGGPWGYAELLEAYRDPSHERHREVLEYHGGDFDPEAFDPAQVKFDDPRERLKVARAGM